MEIRFQKERQVCEKPNRMSPMINRSAGKSKSRCRTTTTNNSKFVGVRQRPSGRWVAEIKDTTQKIRMWLGTFETAEEAARAYDEAACLLRGSNTRTNFIPNISIDSPLALRIKNLLNTKKQDQRESVAKVTKPRINTTTQAAAKSCSPTSSSNSCMSTDENSHLPNLSDDAYKPDMSNCINQFELESPGSVSCKSGIDRFLCTQEIMDLSSDHVGLQDGSGSGLTEFERMKVERQISASLYAMNGLQEYMEACYDPNEPVWDLPPLCSLLC